MNRPLFGSCVLSLFALTAFAAAKTIAPRHPKPAEIAPRIVTAPAQPAAPPSDAIVLFDGSDQDEFVYKGSDRPADWILEDGVLTVPSGKKHKDRRGDISTKRKFGDIQLHIEWRTPPRPADKEKTVTGGENLGNSGIKFHEAYELQILDSYGMTNPKRPSGMAGAVYKQHVPLVNACRAPGEWQTYDIVFRAPYFAEDGSIEKHGTLTVFHNGVLVQDNATVWCRTNSQAADPTDYENPFFLQDHSNPVSYRNIWVRKLERRKL